MEELRLKHLNQKQLKNLTMQEFYRNFLLEYETLGHMKRVENTFLRIIIFRKMAYIDQIKPLQNFICLQCFIPHTFWSVSRYFLLKSDATEDIFHIMARFHTHKCTFTANIEQMFLQILIEPSETLRIVCTPEINEDPIIYLLKTIMDGTACTSVSALRTWKHLSVDEAHAFSLALQIILRDVYVDDAVSCALETAQELRSLETAQELRSQLK